MKRQIVGSVEEVIQVLANKIGDLQQQIDDLSAEATAGKMVFRALESRLRANGALAVNEMTDLMTFLAEGQRARADELVEDKPEVAEHLHRIASYMDKYLEPESVTGRPELVVIDGGVRSSDE